MKERTCIALALFTLFRTEVELYSYCNPFSLLASPSSQFFPFLETAKMRSGDKMIFCLSVSVTVKCLTERQTKRLEKAEGNELSNNLILLDKIFRMICITFWELEESSKHHNQINDESEPDIQSIVVYVSLRGKRTHKAQGCNGAI